MQRCVDAGDIDGLLTIVSLDDIALAWHRYVGADEPKGHHHPDWWAMGLLMDSDLFQRTDLHRALLLKLIEHGPDDALGYVAAGPLEDLLSDDEEDLVWLETQCTHNSRLREALAEACCATWVSDATMARLDAAARQPLLRLRP